MLYDPKWEAPQVKADPMTLGSLIAWLEKQPADTEYCWPNVTNCLACKYFESLGHERPWMHAYSIHPNGYAGPFETHARYHEIGKPSPWTFGAALNRARKVAAAS